MSDGDCIKVHIVMSDGDCMKVHTVMSDGDCMKVHIFMSDGDSRDTYYLQLFIELGALEAISPDDLGAINPEDLGAISPEDTGRALHVLQFLTSLESSITAYGIMLTVPFEVMTED
jgi:hypothetical protein